MLHGHICAAFDDSVSIHAPRCREAMPRPTATPTTDRPFQSTPLVAERRCSRISIFGRAWGCFNPRPSLPRGDASPMALAEPQDRVSIHAPRCREAMPVGRVGACTGIVVSIHAPRCREAMPRLHGRPTKTKGFQSTPLVAERRCINRYSKPPRTLCFNPRPSLPRGDARNH